MTGNVAEWTNDYPPFYGERRRLDPRYGPLEEAKERRRYYAGPDLVSVRGGSHLSVSREFQLHFIVQMRPEVRDMAIGFRCVVPINDFDRVASGFQVSPFARLYESYGYADIYGRNFYKSWWYSVYMKYLEEERRQKRNQEQK
jgi:hypothetical protein